MDKVLHIAVMTLIIIMIVLYSFQPDLPPPAGPYVKDAIKALFFIVVFLMNPMGVLDRLRGITIPLPSIGQPKG